jgi:hypothetical protein
MKGASFNEQRANEDNALISGPRLLFSTKQSGFANAERKKRRNELFVRRLWNSANGDFVRETVSEIEKGSVLRAVAHLTLAVSKSAYKPPANCFLSKAARSDPQLPK